MRRTVTDLAAQADLLRTARYGMIEVIDGRLSRVVIRSLPKWTSWFEVFVVGLFRHRHRRGNRCRLYFNQPRRFPKFLNVPYVETLQGTPYRTFLAATRALDQIAEIKQTDALLCHVINRSLTDEVMIRLGWERHCPNRLGRHFIKRFYGTYPG